MASKLGMNPEVVRDHSAAIEAQLGLLDAAQQSLTTAMVVSNNPLEYLLSPGSMIVAPWSISQLALAKAEVLLAQSSARELAGKLLAEATAQEWASGAQDASYETGIAWRTPDAKTIPELDLWDVIGGPLNFLKGVADDVSKLYGLGEAAFLAASKWAAPLAEKFTKWWDELPPWATKLKKFGAKIPLLGSAVSGIDFAIALEDGDVAGMVRHGGSLIIDGVTAVLAPTVVGGLIGAGVGILWDVGWDVSENIPAIIEDPSIVTDYYGENPWMIAVHSVFPVTNIIWGPFVD